MNLIDKFSHIEGITFASYLNVSSGFRVLQRGLEESDILAELIMELKGSPKLVEEVFERFFSLLKDIENPEYMHPHDPALAGYLYVLSKTDHVQAYLAARKAQSIEQLWWTRKLAQKIIEDSQTAQIQMTFSFSISPSYKVKNIRLMSLSASQVIGEKSPVDYSSNANEISRKAS